MSVLLAQTPPWVVLPEVQTWEGKVFELMSKYEQLAIKLIWLSILLSQLAYVDTTRLV